jgi:hypothetical protein
MRMYVLLRYLENARYDCWQRRLGIDICTGPEVSLVKPFYDVLSLPFSSKAAKLAMLSIRATPTTQIFEIPREDFLRQVTKSPTAPRTLCLSRSTADIRCHNRLCLWRPIFLVASHPLSKEPHQACLCILSPPHCSSRTVRAS